MEEGVFFFKHAVVVWWSEGVKDVFDFVSCDLADINNVDATAIENINYLKESLDKIS